MAGVASTRFTISEEPEFLFAIADEHVFCPLIMVEHHLMVLAANPGHFVAAERGVGRILVIAVDPDATGLNLAAEAIGAVHVTRPNAGAETVQRVVRDGERLGIVFERRHR